MHPCGAKRYNRELQEGKGFGPKEKSTMKLSARNQLKGTITAIHPGAVNAIVILELDGGQLMTASISMGSLKELDLQVGKEAYAIVKASSVIIGLDE